MMFLLKLIFFTFIIISCSKKSEKNNEFLPEKPIAKEVYDSSNFGIYKGVFVGSSGTVVIDINNSGSVIAILKIENISYEFTSSQTIQINKPTVIDFNNGNNRFTFSVSLNGSNPTISNLIINGHDNPTLIVVKELSNTIVNCYEGTFSGGDSGIVNAVIFNNNLKALVRSNVYNSTVIATGTINNNQISAGTANNGATFVGMANGKVYSGTWNNSLVSAKGSWTMKRID